MFYHLGGEKTTGRGEEGSPLVSCARATRGLRRPSLDARSGRPSRPPSGEVNEQAWKSENGAARPSFLLAESARSECAHSMRAVRRTA